MAEERIFVGGKDISRYISACFFSLGKEKSITLVARGNNIKRAIDILAILVRDYIDNPEYKDAIKMENLEDTLIDLANYSLLCIILLREYNEKGNNSTTT